MLLVLFLAEVRGCHSVLYNLRTLALYGAFKRLRVLRADCTGLGDSNGRSVPTDVKDIGLVGQVACGSLHTLVLSADGWTVWSFGDGDGGQSSGYS